MLTRKDIIKTENTINRQDQLIHKTFSGRKNSQEAWSTWENACLDFHNTTLATDFLWSRETQLNIRSGNRESIDDALLFLEVDPWYFRSGYLKETLIDSLKNAPLTDDDKSRIRNIIISIASGRNRREFRRFCKLAIKVTSDDFEQMLDQLARIHDSESSGKFSYLLQYLRQNRSHK